MPRCRSPARSARCRIAVYCDVAVQRVSGGDVGATLEPRLVMKGEAGTHYVDGEFFVASYQRGYRWGRHEVRQLLDDIRANAKTAEEAGTIPSNYYLQPVVVLRRDDDSWELV